MEERTFARLRDWVEPAHPAVIQLYGDLINIYTLIRSQYQQDIDRAFDQISRHIGFVVTTTVPAVMNVGDDGEITYFGMGAEHLRGTIFDKVFSETLSPLVGSRPDMEPWVSSGTYKLYLLWYDALKLKLRTDWMEPAHVFKGSLTAGIRAESLPTAAKVRPEVMEPAHWFDPGRAIAAEDAALIAVIDEVYPELRLADRVATVRDYARKQVRPEVMEPAHYRLAEAEKLRLAEAERLQRPVRPEVMEPAHFRVENREDLARLLRTLLERI